MIRISWFVVAFLLVALAGCSQEQIADMILDAALQPTANHFGAETSSEDAEFVTQCGRSERFQELATALGELRQTCHTDSTEPVDARRIAAMVDRVQQSAEALILDSGDSDARIRQFREAQLAALQLAAERVPQHFKPVRDRFCRDYFQYEFAEFKGADSSSLHILNAYLAAPKVSPQALSALTLHALTYPDCPMNVQLFSTMAERLANENKSAAAIVVAQEGSRLCADQPGVESLRRQVERIRAKKKSTADPLP